MSDKEYTCTDCKKPCNMVIMDLSFDYAGTHCTGGVGGTHHASAEVSDCCEADVREGIICNVCDERIDDDEEYVECEPCGLPFHFNACGGKCIAYGVDTQACDNCRKHD